MLTLIAREMVATQNPATVRMLSASGKQSTKEMSPPCKFPSDMAMGNSLGGNS